MSSRFEKLKNAKKRKVAGILSAAVVAVSLSTYTLFNDEEKHADASVPKVESMTIHNKALDQDTPKKPHTALAQKENPKPQVKTAASEAIIDTQEPVQAVATSVVATPISSAPEETEKPKAAAEPQAAETAPAPKTSPADQTGPEKTTPDKKETAAASEQQPEKQAPKKATPPAEAKVKTPAVPKKTPSAPPVEKEEIKETLGTVTGLADVNSIELDIEGQIEVFNCDGNPELQKEISQIIEGSGVVIRFIETAKGEKIIKDLFVVYDPEAGDLSEFTEGEYAGLADADTVKVIVNNETVTYKLSSYVTADELDQQFSIGDKVSVALVKTPDGLVVEKIDLLP
ncbi:hypothetical protein [Peribacillus sp. SCS-155]|uniref:hypothetical protein n=1 Tax=Peribacillus sedimenti TaxID=3115297 RepID=UPI003905F2C9